MCKLFGSPKRTNANSRAIQERQWKTALYFKKNDKGNYVYIKVLSPEEHFKKVFNIITDSDLLFLLWLIFYVHYIMSNRTSQALYISNSKLAKITGLVNLSYFYYLPSISNKKYLEYAKELEKDILEADLHNYPQLTKAKKKIKENNEKQLIERLLEDGIELDNKDEAIKNAVKIINDYLGEKKDILPSAQTSAVIKDFFTHVSASLNYKISSSLNVMEKLGLINYEKVLLGFKKDGNKTQIYQLTSEEKDKYLVLRNEVARKSGFIEYRNVVIYKLYQDFEKVFNPVIEREMGYYKIISSNRIFYDITSLLASDFIYESYLASAPDDFILSIAEENSKEFKKAQIKNSDKRNKDKPYNKYLFKVLANDFLAVDKEDFQLLYDELSLARAGLEDVEPFLFKVPKLWKELGENKNIIVQKNTPLNISNVNLIFDEEDESNLLENEEEFVAGYDDENLIYFE